MTNKVTGKGNIYAEIVCDSVNHRGHRVTTFRLHYPRFIHSEFMTHRMVSKNASSSRAIPVHKQLDSIKESPAMPVHWGLNQPGMQANTEGDTELDRKIWEDAAASACAGAVEMWNDGKGYHKQIVNRLTEPFTFMNVVATATDWENFFWLRLHPDAQPEIAELARVMYEAREASTPKELICGEWHLPYVDSFRDTKGMLQYCDFDGEEIYSLDEAKKISASCCAQVSYRNLDQSLAKAISIYDRLVGMEPLHASPFEHQCTPFSDSEFTARDSAYAVLYDTLINLYPAKQAHLMASQAEYCGNFIGWTQARKLLPNENLRQKFENNG